MKLIMIMNAVYLRNYDAMFMMLKNETSSWGIIYGPYPVTCFKGDLM